MRFKKMLMNYFIAYFLIFIMVLCTMLPLSNQIHANSRKQVLETNQMRLQRGVLELTQYLSQMTQMSSLMCVDNDLLRLARIRQSNTDTESLIYTLRVKKQINSYLSLMDYVQFCGVFFNNRLFISNEMISHDYHSIWGNLLQIGNMNLDEFESYLSNTASSISCVQECSVIHGSSTDNCLLFISHGALSPQMSNICTYVFGVNAAAFLKNLAPEILQDNGFVLLLDASGNALAGLGAEANPEFLDQLSSDTVLCNNEPFLVFQDSYAAQGLRLVIGVPESKISQSTHVLTDFMSMYLVSSVFFSILLCGCYTIWHYRSVKKTVEIGAQCSDRPYQYTTGYKYIQNVLKEIAGDKDKLKREYSILNSTYFNSMLLNACLYGVYTTHEIECLENFVGKLPVCCIATLRFSEQFDTSQIIQLEMDLPNQLPDCQVFPIRQKPQKSILLISSEKEEQHLPQMVADALNRLLAPCHAYCGSVSDTLSGVEMLQQGYKQTQHMLRTQDSTNFSGHLEVCQTNESSNPLAEVSLFKKLNDLIASGSREGTIYVFEMLNKRVSFAAQIPDEQFRELFYSLSFVLSGIAADLQIKRPQVTIPPEASYPELLNSLKQEALAIIDSLESQRESKIQKTYQTILEKMESQLTNPGLNAAQIAMQLEYSEKYIYKVIKNNSGNSFNELLETMRIRRADELLRNTQKPNEQIAQEAGFASLSTFYRAFRKAYGVTPAVWRNAHQKNDFQP